MRLRPRPTFARMGPPQRSRSGLAKGLALALVACAAATAGGCAHAGEGSPGPLEPSGPDSTVEVIGDQLVRTFDLNHDHKPDDWKTYRLVPDLSAEGKPARAILVKRELDTNFDGKVDVTTWFNEDGTRQKEMFDLDFDGKPDVIDTYEKGILVRKDTFHGHDGKPDMITYYESGKKVRVERDARGGGRIDTWEYFEGGKLSRIGEDLDGDGLVDRWIKAKDEEPEDAGAKKAAQAPAKK